MDDGYGYSGSSEMVYETDGEVLWQRVAAGDLAAVAALADHLRDRGDDQATIVALVCETWATGRPARQKPAATQFACA